MSVGHELQGKLAIEKGRRDSERLMQDCFDGLSLLLHDQHVQVNGKGYPIKVINHNGKLMFDIRDLLGFDHVEFTVEQTGWGRLVNQIEGDQP